MDPVEIFRGAKEALAKRGHTKEGYFVDGCVCVVGACAAAAGFTSDLTDGFPAFENSIKPFLAGAAGGEPTVWNDRPETTVDDVQALLDRAIALAEGK